MLSYILNIYNNFHSETPFHLEKQVILAANYKLISNITKYRKAS